MVSMTSAFLAAVTLVGCVTSVQGDAFLHKAEIEEALLSELTGHANTARLRIIEEELRPMYSVLPQSEQGRLDPSTVRYALHRYFVQKHGWYMKGLEPAGGNWTSASDSGIMKDRAPAYIQGLFSERMHGQGLDLHGLAVFAATLSDLILHESVSILKGVYSALDLSAITSWEDSDKVLKAFLVNVLLGADMSLYYDVETLETLEEGLKDAYPHFDATWMWAQDVSRMHDLKQQSRRNPFVQHAVSFEELVVVAQELGHHFGSFQNLECSMLKERLLEMENEATGRVQLSRFYSGGLDGDFTFTESVSYLRNLGVLDETDPQRPSVVIPNYIKSHSNCLASSGFYSVCCFDECESLLGRVERAIAAPMASPMHIAAVVSHLASDTVSAPRNLSTTLMNRLNEIAHLNGGHVPLHGRLFAQWMHHAYPRECVFPHVSGTTRPVTPDEWMMEHGLDSLDASQGEMMMHVMSAQLESEDAKPEAVPVPWIAVEELLVDHQQTGWAASLRQPMGFFVLGAALTVAIRAASAAVDTLDQQPTPKCSDGVLV